MYASDEVDKIVEELEFIETERRQLHANGPHFRILHRSARQFTPCGSYEPVAAYLVHAGRTYQVRLGTLLGLFDYMARHNKLAQTARQIERGTRTGSSMVGRLAAVPARRIPRRYIRVYTGRIRMALGKALHEAGIEVSPDAVLVSEECAMNETGYRFHATFEWLHIVE